jgi:hypothetical protein
MFGLRALVTLPLNGLEPLGPAAVDGFLRRDKPTLRALAAIELEAYGVTPADTSGEAAVSP